MINIASVDSAALMILRQSASVASTDSNERSIADTDLASIANGLSEKVAVSKQPGNAESRISETMFSVNNVNVNKLKIELIDRASEALGFDRDDFESTGQFAAAMRVSLAKMSVSDAGKEFISSIEKDLRLNELGVTLLDVVSSARQPELEDKVTDALREREGLDDKEKEEGLAADPMTSALHVDELGIYKTEPL